MSRPYFASMTCHPAPSKNSTSFLIFWSGITRSRLWRLTSTTHITYPRPCSDGSAIASQMLPSSSSASPTSAMNLAGSARRSALEVRVDVAAGHGGEQRRHRAEPDRAGGEVGHVRILRPAGVGLQTADLAQPREVRPVELAREVLDGVVHRAGVRLHRHLVVAAEMAEPQRGHDRHHRGRRRLVAADLDRHVARRRHPLPIGVVDHAHRQPEHPSLDPIERVQITGVTVDGHRPIMPALGARDGPTRSRRTWTATTVR